MPTTPRVVIGRKRIVLRAAPSMRPGREGTVYPDPTDPDYVVKVMHAPDEPWREKVDVMGNNPLSASDVAWPVGKVLSANGKLVVGVRLPFAARKSPILCVYGADPTTPWIHGDYAFRLRVAENLAAAMEKVHQHGCVVGDVSENNVLVGRDASVCLIDVDSMQITRDGRTYRCTVGTEAYTPTELHGAEAFAAVDRTVFADAFGIACLIFQLLVGPGNHPFAAVYQGNGNQLGLVQRIQQGIWAYAGTHPDYAPRTAAPFDLLHPLLQPLMRRCFIDGHAEPRQRPLPADWLVALREVRHDADFLYNVAPQLEREAHAAHAAAVAQNLRGNCNAGPAFRAVKPRNKPFRRQVAQPSATARPRSPAKNRVAVRLAAIAATVLAVAVASLGLLAWPDSPGIRSRKSGDEPLPAPAFYGAADHERTAPRRGPSTLSTPDLYEQMVKQHRLIWKEERQ